MNVAMPFRKETLNRSVRKADLIFVMDTSNWFILNAFASAYPYMASPPESHGRFGLISITP